jgi:hypothetical protein
MIRHALLATALTILAPATASACGCIFTASLPPLREHPVIFVGSALTTPEGREDSRPREATFVTEASWRGALPDTVVVAYTEAPCARFVAATRYLVFAEPDPAATGRYRLTRCGPSITAFDARGLALQDSLGVPSWRASPVGARALDRVAIALDQRVSSTRDPERVVFFPPHLDPPGEFTIAGHVASVGAEGNRPLWFLPPALYQFRIRWRDGHEYVGYVRLECELRSPGDGQCLGFRTFSHMRAAP